MTAELDRPYSVFRIVADGVKFALEQLPFELRIHTITTAIAFTNLGAFVRLGNQRAFT
ncbi:hypothetical protein D3C78_1734600 [compost metagenome]